MFKDVNISLKKIVSCVLVTYCFYVSFSQKRGVVNDSKNIIKNLPEMDVFDSRYFRLNKKVLSAMGLWPFGDRRKTIRKCYVTILLIFTIPNVIALIVDFPDTIKIMEHLFYMLFVIQVLLKYVTLASAEEKMQSVYHGVANNWLTIVSEEEKKILLKYSEWGRFVSTTYMLMLLASLTTFCFMPLLPEILNAIDPLPEPRPHIHILKSEFLVNKDDHFYKLYVWDALNVCCIVAIFMAIDPMYMATVEQGTALYAIITHRLSKLRGRVLRNFQDVTDSSRRNVSSYEWVIHIIKLHQQVLSFTDNIQDTYSTCFFCLSMINVVLVPLTCVITLRNWQDPVLLIRYSSAAASLLIGVFTLFWPAQRLTDHSTNIIVDAYCNDWYETPARTKKILRFFMLRISRPCILTAGGLMEMNLQVYSQIVKTAASYVTVLASFQ